MCGDTCGNSAMQMCCEECFGMCDLCFLEKWQRTLGSLLALTLATSIVQKGSFLLGRMRTRAHSADTKRILTSAVMEG